MYSLMVFLKLSWWREFSKVCPSKSWEVASYGGHLRKGAQYGTGGTLGGRHNVIGNAWGCWNTWKLTTGKKILNFCEVFFNFFSFWAFSIWGIISCIAGIGISNPPQKHHSTLFCRAPLLNLQTVQASLFRQSLSISVFFELPP